MLESFHEIVSQDDGLLARFVVDCKHAFTSRSVESDDNYSIGKYLWILLLGQSHESCSNTEI